MLFHACWVIYTVKELDSRAKHGQRLKKKLFGRIAEYFRAKYTGLFTSFGKYFSIIALPDVMKGGTPCMGISPEKACPRTHRPEREQEPDHSAALHGKNVSKEVCCWLWGKDNLVQLPEEPSVTWTVDAVRFFGAAMEFCKCVSWPTFY